MLASTLSLPMHRNTKSLFSLLALAVLWCATSASAQVLVYKLDFRKDKGVNYHTYSGGYFIAPLLGGEGTFLLTDSTDGRTYTEAANAGRLFTAINHGETKAVISATTGTGTAEGALVVIGDVDKTIKVNSPTLNLSAKVAGKLTGMAVTADDESGADGPASDGSLGSAGFSQLVMDLDEEETNRNNGKGFNLEKVVEELRKTLERAGYAEATTDDGADSSDTTDSTTTTTPAGS